jgi:hypothetical protein
VVVVVRIATAEVEADVAIVEVDVVAHFAIVEVDHELVDRSIVVDIGFDPHL